VGRERSVIWGPGMTSDDLRSWLLGMPDGGTVADELVRLFREEAPAAFREPDECVLCEGQPYGWGRHPVAEASTAPIGLCERHLDSEDWSTEVGWCASNKRWGKLGATCPLCDHDFGPVPSFLGT
jgi:hypothetical protein